MKFILKVLVLIMTLSVSVSASAGPLEDYTTALRIRLAAAACLASYSNPNGGLVRELG